MVSIPSDEIVLSTFKRVSVWNLTNPNRNAMLDKVFTKGLLREFTRSKYENNYLYFSREYYLFVKISQNVNK